MCFGWLNSPYFFNVLMKDVMGQVRSGRFEEKVFGPPTPITIWVDDYLAFVEGVEDGLKKQQMIETIAEFNGVPLHPDKGERYPVKRLERHLGHGIDLEKGWIFTPTATLQRMKSTAKQILRSLCRHQRWIYQFR